MLIVAAPILIPLATAFVIPLVSLISEKLRAPLSIISAILTLGALAAMVEPVFLENQVLIYWMGGWIPQGHAAVGISLAVDAWGLLMAGIIALIGLLCMVFSSYHMRKETGETAYYVLMLLMLAAMIGFCLTGDLFNQFVWLEILSVSAFALTGFYYQEKTSVEAAFKYLITNSIASLFVVVGLTLLYTQTGALNLAQIASKFQPTTAGMVAVGLLLGGYATKAGLVPWHFWLPDAYQTAPAPAAAFFSGALSKVGIYAIGRVIFTLAPISFSSTGQDILLTLAAITMLVGGIQVLQQGSIRRILAYSSISQMGYILLGLALGTPLGIAAAALHAMSHALLEPTLFFGSGSISRQAGVSQVVQGSALASRMPLTFGLMAFAGLGLSGMPFFSGFISKAMLENASLASGVVWMAIIAAVTSIFTFAGIGRLLVKVFVLGRAQPREKQVFEAPLLALLPMLIPILLAFIIGVAPGWVASNMTWSSAEALLDPGVYIHNGLAYLPVENFTVLPLETPPSLAGAGNWITPLITLLLGSLVAYSLLKPGKLTEQAWVRPIRSVGLLIKSWHSGLVSDYVLWNAFSTTLIVSVLVIAMIL